MRRYVKRRRVQGAAEAEAFVTEVLSKRPDLFKHGGRDWEFNTRRPALRERTEASALAFPLHIGDGMQTLALNNFARDF